MAEASVTFAVGAEQATIVLPVDLPSGGETILTGDIDAVVLAGTTARLRGACRLLNNLHVRGILTADPDAVLDGQGLWDIHTHDGGVLDLQGTQKTAWTGWGGHRYLDDPTNPVVGWEIGDRLAVAPTRQVFNAQGVMTGVFVPSEMTWSGDWATMTRPSDSPNVLLENGRIALPEVVNLSQTLVLKNLTRIMLHESTVPNVHTLKWLNVQNCGKSNELTMYPVHFHFLHDTCRGSLVEGVVVEGGKNHAFVPHASHGIDFIGCAAVNTLNDAFWWDIPPQTGDVTINDSHDTNWDGCLVLGLKGSPGDGGAVGARLTAFLLGAGTGNKCNNSVAVGVEGFQSSSGYHWPERGIGVWEFNGNAVHNCKFDGIFVWQNSVFPDHLIDGFTAYRCGKAGVEHGAYSNFYDYRNMTFTQNLWGMFNHALSWQLASVPNEFLEIEDVISDTPLRIAKHNNPSTRVTYYRRCSFPSVHYGETANGSVIHFEDCGLVPADFNFSLGISPNSVIELKEAGVLTHRWQSGVWS